VRNALKENFAMFQKNLTNSSVAIADTQPKALASVWLSVVRLRVQMLNKMLMQGRGSV
jgi:hypothetical protein